MCRMKCVFVIFAALLSVASTKSFLASTAENTCTPGTNWMLECNRCWCTETRLIICTQTKCESTHPAKIAEESIRKIRDVSAAQPAQGEYIKSCDPKETFRLDCNTCLCNDEGRDYACTRFDCTQQITKREANNYSCIPGESFKHEDGCNTCLCSDDGLMSCTKRACLTLHRDSNHNIFKRETENTTNKTKEKTCEPGTTFKRDCNTCKCAENGKDISCTEKACAPQQQELTVDDPNFRCTPGDQFKKDCNDCTCSAHGKSMFCTLNLCV